MRARPAESNLIRKIKWFSDGKNIQFAKWIKSHCITIIWNWPFILEHPVPLHLWRHPIKTIGSWNYCKSTKATFWKFKSCLFTGHETLSTLLGGEKIVCFLPPLVFLDNTSFRSISGTFNLGLLRFTNFTIIYRGNYFFKLHVFYRHRCFLNCQFVTVTELITNPKLHKVQA
jgi:hypothetical protein